MSWRFLATPKWIVRHVLVVVLVAAMVTAMFWQLRRLDDKRSYKALVEDRQAEAVVPVLDLLAPEEATDAPAVDEVLYRSVSAAGEYRDDETVVVENRTYNGTSGGWVLTPLELGDGVAVVVNRGFVGYDLDGEVVAPPAPAGPVRVTGLLFPSQRRGSFGARDPEEGTLARLARVDLDRYERQTADDLLPAYVQLVTSDPAEPGPAAAGRPQLVALGPPELSEGPHLSYAAQWAIFSAIAIGGYGLLLRRVARDEARPSPEGGSAGGGPVPS